MAARDDDAPGAGYGPIINELLCFVINKVSVLPHDTIVKLCVDTYEDTEIEAAKQLLFEVCGSDEFRLIKRSGQMKSNNNMSDILKLIHVTDSSVMPCFVAADLSKLPPVTEDYIDMSQFVKDISKLKTEMLTVKNLANKTAENQSEMDGRLNSITDLFHDDKRPSRREDSTASRSAEVVEPTEDNSIIVVAEVHAGVDKARGAATQPTLSTGANNREAVTTDHHGGIALSSAQVPFENHHVTSEARVDPPSPDQMADKRLTISVDKDKAAGYAETLIATVRSQEQGEWRTVDPRRSTEKTYGSQSR